MNPQTAVTTNKATTTPTLRQALESETFKLQVARVLPKHLTPDRFIRIAATTIMRTPLLAQCDQVSFFNALLTLSQLGIEPDGRRAHLIPFRNTKRDCVECQLIVDYKGLAELVMRSGVVSYLHADLVCENDEFLYDRGQIAKHTIDFRRPRGKAYAVYAICKFKDGTEKAEVMSTDDVESIRRRSRAGQSGPWVTDWNEMAKKTVFRRLSKWLPLSPEFRDAVEADADSVVEVLSDQPEQPSAFTAPELPAAPEAAKRRPGRPRTRVEPEVKEAKPLETAPAMEAEPEGPSVESSDGPPVAALQTPQEMLANKIIEAGFTWDDLVEWNAEMQFIEGEIGTLAGFDDLGTNEAVRLLNSIAGLIRALKTKKAK